jgi:hypothetical protein
MRSRQVWMRLSQVVTASGCQCQSPGFDPSILRHSVIWEAADEAVLNNVHKNKKFRKITPFETSKKLGSCHTQYLSFYNYLSNVLNECADTLLADP